jgi:hypothetical protein
MQSDNKSVHLTVPCSGVTDKMQVRYLKRLSILNCNHCMRTVQIFKLLMSNFNQQRKHHLYSHRLQINKVRPRKWSKEQRKLDPELV